MLLFSSPSSINCSGLSSSLVLASTVLLDYWTIGWVSPAANPHSVSRALLFSVLSYAELFLFASFSVDDQNAATTHGFLLPTNTGKISYHLHLLQLFPPAPGFCQLCILTWEFAKVQNSAANITITRLYQLCF